MPAIESDIFQKLFVTTPTETSTPIYDLCRELKRGGLPQWISVRPDDGAVVNECFNNVSSKIERSGGAIVFGWAIWEWPRVFIEAEHHAVWESEGELLDITPHINGESRILFLADPTRRYDFESKTRIINVKRSLGKFASADRWIAACDTLQRTLEDHSVGNTIRMNRNRLVALWENARNAQAQVLVDLATNTKVNDRCICTSGKKFKKCCAPMIDLSV